MKTNEELIDWLSGNEITMDCLSCPVCSSNNGKNCSCAELTNIFDADHESRFRCRERIAWYLKQQLKKEPPAQLTTREEALYAANNYFKEILSNPTAEFKVRTDGNAFVVGSKRFEFERPVKVGDLCWVADKEDRLTEDDCPVQRIEGIDNGRDLQFYTKSDIWWKYARRVRPDEL